MKKDGWSRKTGRTAPVGVSREALVAGADRAGAVIISTPRLAAAAGTSVRTAWGWLNGERVSQPSELRLRSALGVPLPR